MCSYTFKLAVPCRKPFRLLFVGSIKPQVLEIVVVSSIVILVVEFVGYTSTRLDSWLLEVTLV